MNEVEAAGNTPLHCAAYEGWLEGCELLLNLGAKVRGCDSWGGGGELTWKWALWGGSEGGRQAGG